MADYLSGEEFVSIGQRVITDPEGFKLLMEVESDPCPTCGRMDCTLALIDKYLIMSGRGPLKDIPKWSDKKNGRG